MTEIERTNSGFVIPTGFYVMESIGQVLPRGHVIHGYSSAMNERVIKILDNRKYSDSEPMLGFGVDGNAERALIRALYTYGLREIDQRDAIKASTYPTTDTGMIYQDYNQSMFDNIVWGADIYMYQEGEEYVVGSNYSSGNPFQGCEARACTLLGALGGMTEQFYDYPEDSRRRWPIISLE